MFYCTKYNSPIGKLTIASDENNIIGLWIEGQKYFGSTIIIPCHRVIGSKGDLKGYAGGIETKKTLLEFEKVKIN